MIVYDSTVRDGVVRVLGPGDPPVLPPILLTAIYLLTRRWPRWLETRLTGQPVAFHRNGSVGLPRQMVQAAQALVSDVVIGLTTDEDGGW